jgi:hypothetical protein
MSNDSFLEELLDEILPEELDWDRLVRRYPIPAVLLAAVGGFFLGRSHGPSILSAASSFAASEMAKNVNELFGQEGR